MVMRRWVLAVAACALIRRRLWETTAATKATGRPGRAAPKAGTGAQGRQAAARRHSSRQQAMAGACDNEEELSKCMGVDKFTDLRARRRAVCRPASMAHCKAYDDVSPGSRRIPCNNTCTRSLRRLPRTPQCLIDNCLELLDSSKCSRH